jgi:hypothetical protein
VESVLPVESAAMSPTCVRTTSNKHTVAIFVVVVLIVLGTPNFSVSGLSSDDVASPLNCDAFSAKDAGHLQPTSDNPLLDTTSEAPSDAPSAAPLCSDRLSNARGVYTSIHAPCTIKFHSVAQFQREGEEKEVEFIDYRTSNLCRDDNVIVEIKEYLETFPDECVGDFDRCYSLEHHSKYLYPFLCLPEDFSPNSDSLLSAISYRLRWELPPGTTHVSVDCTVDRVMAKEEIKSRHDEARKHNRDARREEIGLKLFNWVLVFVSSLAVIYAFSHLVVTPLVKVAALKGRGQRRRRRSSRSCRRSRTFRTSSTLSTSFSSLPLHHQEQLATLVLEDDALVSGRPATELSEERPRREHGDDDLDNISGPSSSDDSYSYETVHEDEDEQQMNDFDSQVPCDFDAVPIVAATVLTLTDAIPATVVEDGVSYL